MIKISDTEYFSNDKTIRFLNMDCNEFMAGCKENEFDLNLSDPPYGINWTKSINYSEKQKAHQNKCGYKTHIVKEWDSKRPEQIVFDNIKATSKNQIIWGGNYFTDMLPITRCWIVWDKQGENFTAINNELAWTSFETKIKVFSRCQGLDKGFMNKDGGGIHPTEKPVELYKWIIDNYTKPTDTILDCFGGSMSNAIACHMKRRKLTIIELDVDYFKSALNRFEIYERQVEDIKEFGYAKTKINAQNPVLF